MDAILFGFKVGAGIALFAIVVIGLPLGILWLCGQISDFWHDFSTS